MVNCQKKNESKKNRMKRGKRGRRKLWADEKQFEASVWIDSERVSESHC